MAKRIYAAVPHEYLEEMELLNDAEFGRLIRALLKYSMTGEIPSLSGSERVLFPRVKMQEDRFQESYEDLSTSRSEAGKKGAAKRWSKSKSDDSPNSKPASANGKNGKATVANSKDGKAMPVNGKNGNTETETDTDTDTNTITPSIDGSNSKGAKAPARKRFIPPTLEQVQEYCTQRQNNVDPQYWFDYYSSNGWKVGKNSMQDWKASVRTWERNSYQSANTSQRGSKTKPRNALVPAADMPDDKMDIESKRRMLETMRMAFGEEAEEYKQAYEAGVREGWIKT